MRQAEKALRDAGWEEILYGDLDKGEEFYFLRTGALLIKGNREILDTESEVLRAPRPEPKWDHGTVARIRDSLGSEENATYGTFDTWAAGNRSFPGKDVEVLRVFAYPDGTSPWINLLGSQVNRIKVIDESGYGYINDSARDVEYAFEDDDQTFKIFTGGTGVTPRPGDSSGQCTPGVDAINERMDARARELLDRLWDKLDGKDDTE